MTIYTVVDSDGEPVSNVIGSNKMKAILRAEHVLDDVWESLQDEGYRLAEATLSVGKIYGPVDIEDLD